MSQKVYMPLSPPPPLRDDEKLGTAAWHEFPADTNPTFGRGDIWLGRTDGGSQVGHHDDRHILVCGGTRGGKGTTVIVPNLLLWRGSAFVIDPKGENAILTARRRGHGSIWARGMGQRVQILDPYGEVRSQDDDFADLRACFNPLDLVRPAIPGAIGMAAKIAEGVIASDGNTHEPIWEDASRGAMRDIILHVVSSRDFGPPQRNLITVRRLLREGDREMSLLAEQNGIPGEATPSGLEFLFRAMQKNPAFGGVVASAGSMLLDTLMTAPKQLTSMLMTARVNTDWIDDPEMQVCLSRSTFSPDELKTDPKGMSLFLCLPQRYMDTNYRWLRMMTNIVVSAMEASPIAPKSGQPVLMVLDEFAGLKRMRTIETAIAQIAGAGVKMMLVVQTLAQLKDVYKDNWETIVANCGVKYFFNNDDHFTRDYVSKLAGEREIIRVLRSAGRSSGTSETSSHGGSESETEGSSEGYSSFNNSRSKTEGSNRGHSNGMTDGSNFGTSESVHKRMLLNPDEVGRLFSNPDDPKALVLIGGHQPLALRRTAYFSDEMFAGLYDPHPKHRRPPTLVMLDAMRRSAVVPVSNWPVFDPHAQRVRANSKEVPAVVEALRDVTDEAVTFIVRVALTVVKIAFLCWLVGFLISMFT